MKQTLWTRDFTRITAATTLGAAGGIISQFALSFLVFDETGSTLAAALAAAIQLFPMALLPLLIAPMMDRLPRKPFLMWGDLLNGVCYAGAGLFLLHRAFSYTAYLGFSLLVSCLGAFDELAYNSFYPLLLPEGQEERAYTVSAMLYPVLKVLMMPLAALLYDTLGVGRLLLIQAVLSVLAALIENRIRVQENRRDRGPLLSLKTWWRDVREAAAYLRQERSLHGLYVYMAVTNGMGIHHFAAQGYQVFAFEYSGYQGSSGHFYGFPQAVTDLKHALDFVDDGSRPVILMGHSMGAYAVCAVRQYTDKRVDGIVAYAPFFSSDEAVIAEATGNIPKFGKLLCSLILPMQRILFGRNCNPTAVAGLSRANVPALVLQGSADVEVSPDGCALYAHRTELSDAPVTFRLVQEKESSGHMTIVRKKGSRSINTDTMQLVGAFLREVLHSETLQAK